MLLILPIYTCRPCVVYGGRLLYGTVLTVLSFKKNPILYFMPVLILLCLYAYVYIILTTHEYYTVLPALAINAASKPRLAASALRTATFI